MPVIVVANPKGGVGKSTLATNLAGYWAARGKRVMLGDVDKQQSTREWLKLRPPQAAPISAWEIDADSVARPPKGTTHVVLDTPAGLQGAALSHAVGIATHLLVPLQPSMFDILATADFLSALRQEKPVAGRRAMVGVVGMRVDARTRAAEQLARFCEGLGLPVLGYLRNTQNYVQLAAHGLTLWDVVPSRVDKDVAQWNALIAWMDASPARTRTSNP